MADLSVVLFWVGAALTGGSVLFHLAAALGSRVVRRAAATSAGTVMLSERQEPPAFLGRLGSALAALAGLSLVLVVVACPMATGHPSYAKMLKMIIAKPSITSQAARFPRHWPSERACR